MKQITKIQLHRSHWATASGAGEGDWTDGKMNRIGDKTEDGDRPRQKNRERCREISSEQDRVDGEMDRNTA